MNRWINEWPRGSCGGKCLSLELFEDLNYLIINPLVLVGLIYILYPLLSIAIKFN